MPCAANDSGEWRRYTSDFGFITMDQARQWLAEEHGIETDYQLLWYWVKKRNEVLKMPRPSHSKKDPLTAERLRRAPQPIR
jgi:transposase